MKELIDAGSLSKAAKFGKLKSPRLLHLLMHLLSIDKVNTFYEKNAQKECGAFIQALFDELNIQFDIPASDMHKLPKSGAFITISNHPFGGLEGLFLIQLLTQCRPEAKIMGNFLLQKIEPIQSAVIPVNPFEDRKELQSSLSGIKASIRHLQEGHPLGIFPAGEVSSFQTNAKTVSDRQWQPSVLKLIQKSQVPVVPIFFHGANSFMFQVLSALHPNLRTAKLPSELFNKKNKTIKVRIGQPVAPSTLAEFENYSQMGRFLRAKTYALGSPLDIQKFYRPSLKALKRPQPIIDRVPTEIIHREIEAITQKDLCIYEQSDFQLFIAFHTDIPNILQEIGRLREITFRAMEEGTNRKLDLDEYDLYYHHLFIWDKTNLEIVGAYRLGKGKDIMMKYGKRGFYTFSLFRLKNKLKPVLSETVELGRSFIRIEYQRKMLPLFLLWKGILYFMLTNSEYRYLLGPVSISNRYSKLSQSLMIGFIKQNFYRHDLAQLVKPRTKFRIKNRRVDEEVLLAASKADFRSLDKFIQEIEPERYNIPVLLKKYIKQNARIIGFNVDPKFGRALDGLIILDIRDIPASTFEDLKKDFDFKALL